MRSNADSLAGYFEAEPNIAMAVAMATEQAAQNIFLAPQDGTTSGFSFEEDRYHDPRPLGLGMVVGDRLSGHLSPFFGYENDNAALNFYNGNRAEDPQSPEALNMTHIPVIISQRFPRYKLNAHLKAEAILRTGDMSSFVDTVEYPRDTGVMRFAGAVLLGDGAIYSTSGLDQIDDHITSRAGSFAGQLAKDERMTGVMDFDDMIDLRDTIEGIMMEKAEVARDTAKIVSGSRKLDVLTREQVGKVLNVLEQGFFAKL